MDAGLDALDAHRQALPERDGQERAEAHALARRLGPAEREHHRGAVHCVNHKTCQTVCIELNHYSQTALATYVHDPDPLPRISNQRLNDYIKELGYLAGIDRPVTRTWYVGGQRRDETLPRYQFLDTHTGRRTFICMALQLGIPPTTVMQWTGHSGYKAMQPYISASSDATARAMRLFDEMGDTNE